MGETPARGSVPASLGMGWDGRDVSLLVRSLFLSCLGCRVEDPLGGISVLDLGRSLAVAYVVSSEDRCFA
jgi:hypothetical protein